MKPLEHLRLATTMAEMADQMDANNSAVVVNYLGSLAHVLIFLSEFLLAALRQGNEQETGVVLVGMERVGRGAHR